MSVVRQVSSFFGVGVVALGADYGTMIALREGFALGPVPSALAGYCVGGLVSYLLNRRHTFETQRSHAEAGWRFAAVMVVGFSLTWLMMQALTEWQHAPYLPARVVTTGIVFVWNFAAHNLWTFSQAG